MADTRHLWPVWADLIRECRPRCVIGEQVASLGALDWLDRVQADLEAAGYAVAAVDLGAAGVGAPHWRQRLWWVAQHERERTGRASELADTHRNGRGEEGQYLGEAGSNGSVGNHVSSSQRPGPVNGFWADADWIECTDGKWRPVEPGTQPLAHGYPARVGKLRAYGNAICLPVAVEFIKAVMSCEPENLPNT